MGGVTLIPPIPVSEYAVHSSIHVQWRLIQLEYLVWVKRPEGWFLVKRVREGWQLVVASHVVIGSVIFGRGYLGNSVMVDITELAHLFDGEHLIGHWEIVVLQHLNDFSHFSKTRLVVNKVFKRLEITKKLILYLCSEMCIKGSVTVNMCKFYTHTSTLSSEIP